MMQTLRKKRECHDCATNSTSTARVFVTDPTDRPQALISSSLVDHDRGCQANSQKFQEFFRPPAWPRSLTKRHLRTRSITARADLYRSFSSFFEFLSKKPRSTAEIRVSEQEGQSRSNDRDSHGGPKNRLAWDLKNASPMTAIFPKLPDFGEWSPIGQIRRARERTGGVVLRRPHQSGGQGIRTLNRLPGT